MPFEWWLLTARARDQQCGEGARIAAGITAAVIGKPLDRFRRAVHLP
jgi:hypothetical protein